jgi:ubiquinol-cytochrome c reductase iron-sulfur subunit/rieske iron-sulfur protein
MVGAAVLGTAGGAIALETNQMPPQPGDFLVHASGKDKTTRLKPSDIELGAQPIEAWPADPATGEARSGSLTNLLVLSRWDPAELDDSAKANAADGVVANTAICTHAGCEITDWVADTKILEGPCHLSRFDLRRSGAVVNGPAARKLPALGLALDGELLVVAREFDGRIGGDAE